MFRVVNGSVATTQTGAGDAEIFFSQLENHDRLIINNITQLGLEDLHSQIVWLTVKVKN